MNTEQVSTDYILNEQQRTQYEVDGYLLASGLISDIVAEKAEKSMWELMEMDPDNPQTWSNIPTAANHEKSRNIVIYNGIQMPELLACATSEYIQATSELINLPINDIHPPQAIHTQNLFPVKKTWQWPTAHVDGIPKEHMHLTFPGPYRIASLVFLSDVEKFGGGTIVWPGSHHKIRQLAESAPEKYAHLYDLNKDIPALDLGDPIELLPKRGDILFFKHLFGHNGSLNINQSPRLLMRYFCACDECKRWKKTDEWSHWTP